MPSAEIITIGTEILLGEIVDTNTRFIARELRGLGVDLYRTITIGDNTARIADAIRDSMSRAEIVITTGGLGPTVDDPTREAVARAVGVETEFREELWEQVVAVIRKYGREPNENQKRQAYVPRGAIAIPNPVGTAPAFVVEFHREGEKPAKNDELRGRNVSSRPSVLRGKKTGAVISLPGVPKEMEYLMHASVIPYLQKRFDLREFIKVRLLHTSGMSEAMIDEQVGEFERLANPTVGLAAHSGVVDIRIAAKAENESEAERLIASAEGPIRQRLGEVIFGADDDTLEAVTLRKTAERGWTLVVLESGLDGGLSRRLTSLDHPALLSVESLEVAEGALAESTRAARERVSARAALGVALYSSEAQVNIDLCLITPVREHSRRITYGGPPRNAPRWAVNAALNWLRQTVSARDS
ncbi:MAG: competence/damage-inducible protein A [Chloroflexota bacterium]